MRWLRAIPFLALLAWAESVPGCSNGDDTGLGPEDASQPPPTKFEAGSNCSTSEDCETGLVCLFPASTCNALAVCVAPPGPDGGGCETPQYACSCLGEPIQVCEGYAANPVDITSTCEGGIIPVEAGSSDGASDGGGLDGTLPPTEAGSDGSPGNVGADATPAVDASDASDAAGE